MMFNRSKRAITIAGLLSCAFGLTLFFQNCSPSGYYVTDLNQSAQLNSGSPESTIPDSAIPNSTKTTLRDIPTFNREEDLTLWRKRVWGQKCGPKSDWEVCFEGQSIPGANQRAHLDWDNPIDDDWDMLTNSYMDGFFVLKNSWILNKKDSTADSFMRVDRTFQGFEKKSGHFWRRDEFLTQASGLIAEFRLRVLPQSGEKAVKLHFFDDKQEFKLAFSPQTVSFYDLIGDGATAIVSTTSDNLNWKTYRVIKQPVTGEVQVWVDDERIFADKVLFAKSSSLMNKSGYLGRITARIGIGGNNNDPDPAYRAAYDIDFFRYKRFNDAVLRPPYSLVNKEPCDETLAWKSESDLKDYAPYKAGRDVGQFGLTLEFEIEGLAKTPIDPGLPEAISVYYIDMLGGVTATLLPEIVQLKPYSKPSPPASTNVKGLDIYKKNKLRLVRADNGLYWNLYLNGSSIPQIVDVKGCGTSPSKVVADLGRVSESSLKVGAFFDNSVLNLSQETGTPFRVNARNTQKLHSFKWIDRALSPSCSPRTFMDH